MPGLPAAALTPAAQAWLAAASPARVLNVFERACNLVDSTGAILALVTSGRGLNPFALQLAPGAPAPFNHVTLESPVQRQPGSLVVGPLRVDYGSAAVWDPVPAWPALRRQFAASPASLARLAALAPLAAPSGSLLGLYGAAPGGPGLAQALYERARRAAEDLARALAAGDAALSVAAARGLAGLGGGLTPAGDDFIVGALLAAWAGLLGPRAAALLVPVAEAAAARTTILSAAYLRAAAAGACLVQWHAVFAALFNAGELELTAAVRSLTAVGHTSGADSLAGFLAAYYLVPQASV